MLNYIRIQDQIDDIIKQSGFDPKDSGLEELEVAADGQEEGFHHPVSIWFARDIEVQGDRINQSIKLDTSGMTHMRVSNCGGDLRSMRIQQDALVEALGFMDRLQNLPGLRLNGMPVLTEAQLALLEEIFQAEMVDTIMVTKENAEAATALVELGMIKMLRGGDSRTEAGSYQYLVITSFGHELWVRS